MPGFVLIHPLAQGVLKLCRTSRVSSSHRSLHFCCSVSLVTKPLSFLLCRPFASTRTPRAEEGLEISPISLFDALDDKTRNRVALPASTCHYFFSFYLKRMQIDRKCKTDVLLTRIGDTAARVPSVACSNLFANLGG